MKQSDKTAEIGFQRLNAASLEVTGHGDAQPTEATGIDKAQVLARGQFQNCVSVLQNF